MASTPPAPPPPATPLPRYDTLQLEAWRPECVQVTLNRPARKNAFNQQMYNDLSTMLDYVAAAPHISVVLLTGAGDFFSSGADVSDAADPRAGFARFTAALMAFPKVVVVAVNGPAIGIAVTMLPHCDVVYAAGGATFATPFARIAVVPEFCSSYTFPRIMGTSTASELLLMGSTMTATEALAAGLVAKVQPRAALLPFARARIDAALAHPFGAKSLTLFKGMVRRWDADTLRTVHAAETGELLRRMDSGETVAAVMALQYYYYYYYYY
jgi:peroxisomal 3,2-trans-enoyl-CoA isomerase